MASKIKSNLISLGLIQIAGFLLPLLALPHLTRSLSTAGFGKYATVLTIIAILNVISDYGYVTNGTRMVAQNQTNPKAISLIIKKSTSVRLLVSFALSVAYLISSNFLFGFDISLSAIVLISLFSNAIVLQWLFQGLGRLTQYSVFSVISRFICLFLVFAFVKSPDNLELAIFLNVLPQVLSIGYYILFIKQNGLNFGIESDIGIISKEFRKGLHFFLPSVYSTVFTGSGIIVLGLFKDPSTVGIYAVNDRIIKASLSMSGIVSQAIYPVAAEKMNHSNYVGTQFIKKMAKIFIPLFAFFSIILSVSGDVIIKLLFGDSFMAQQSIMVYFPLYVLLANINSFAGMLYLTTSGNEWAYSRAFMYGTFVALVIYFSLSSAISYNAPVLGLILGELVILIYVLSYIRGKNV